MSIEPEFSVSILIELLFIAAEAGIAIAKSESTSAAVIERATARLSVVL